MKQQQILASSVFFQRNHIKLWSFFFEFSHGKNTAKCSSLRKQLFFLPNLKYKVFFYQSHFHFLIYIFCCRYNHYIEEPIRIRDSPILIDDQMSPTKSPRRISSPETLHVHKHNRAMSPSHRRRRDKELMHRKHKREKVRMRDRKYSRSRSPVGRRRSRSPSYGKRHYGSPSPARSRKRHKSRSPRKDKTLR